MALDWQQTRAQFPVTGRWAYLNSATFGPVPRCATAAMEAHFQARDETASIEFLDWFTRADGIRAKVARLIGATAPDIAFIPSAGIALSWMLHGVDWRAGDRIVGLSQEFPNNLYAPLMMQRREVEFVECPVTDGRFDLDEFFGLVNERTRLVLMSEVNYSTGLRPPLAEIGRELRRRGVLFCVDGTQSAGALRMDVEAAGVDVYFAHGYKWMLCPTGIGFLYISAEARSRIEPMVISWRSHEDWRNVDRLHHGVPVLPHAAAKYEGGILNFSGLAAMEAVVEMMLEIGVEEIERRVLEIAEQTRGVLRKHGGRLLSDSHPHYDSPNVAAAFPEGDVSRLAVELRAREIVVAARKGFLRVSPHFFNNDEDLGRLDAALGELL